LDLPFLFLLKKVISFLLYPLSIGFLLTFFGGWLLIRKRVRLAKLFFVLGMFWVFIVSSSFFANPLIESLEKHYKKVEHISSNIEYILLLGGDRKKRAWEALRLYRLLPHTKIVTSGYAVRGKISDAQKAKKLLIEAGVKSEDIVMQTNVKDTIEEAQTIKKRLGNKPFYLVTSAYHMPRAMKIFKSFGLNALAAPTDFNDPNDGEVIQLLSAKELIKTEKAFHEYLGLLSLYIKDLLKFKGIPSTGFKGE